MASGRTRSQRKRTVVEDVSVYFRFQQPLDMSLRYKVMVYVPAADAEKVKLAGRCMNNGLTAALEAGAGR